MRTYYDHNGVWITDSSVTVDGRRFPLADLNGLGASRGRPDPVSLGTVGAAGATSLAALAITPVAPSGAALTVLGAATALTIAAAVLLRLRPRPYQVWSTYRGTAVLLHETTDTDELGKLVRALQRAYTVELHRPRHQDSAGHAALPPQGAGYRTAPAVRAAAPTGTPSDRPTGTAPSRPTASSAAR